MSDANQDEYDSYAAPIVRMLDGEVTAGDLFRHMSDIVTEAMGIGVDKDKTMACALELVKFWQESKPSTGGEDGH